MVDMCGHIAKKSQNHFVGKVCDYVFLAPSSRGALGVTKPIIFFHVRTHKTFRSYNFFFLEVTKTTQALISFKFEHSKGSP